jgi:hypothetical protein
MYGVLLLSLQRVVTNIMSFLMMIILAGDPCSQVVKRVVETSQDIKHQNLVRYCVPEVVKSISLALHLPTVLARALRVVIPRAPARLVRGATVNHCDVLRIKGDGPKDLGHGNTIERNHTKSCASIVVSKRT